MGAGRRGTGPNAARADGIVHPWAVRRRAARRFWAVIAWEVGGRAAAAGRTAGASRVLWGAAHYGAIRVVAVRRRVGSETSGARGIVHPWAVRRRAARLRRAAVARGPLGRPAARLRRAAVARRPLGRPAARLRPATVTSASAPAARRPASAGGCRFRSAPAARRPASAGGCRSASAPAARRPASAGGCRSASAPAARRLASAGHRGWRGSAGAPRAKVSRAGRHWVRADSCPLVCARWGSLPKPAESRSAKRRWAQQYPDRRGRPAQATLVRSTCDRIGRAARRVARVVIPCPWGSARGPVRAPLAAMAARAVPGHARSRSPRVTPGKARRTRRVGRRVPPREPSTPSGRDVLRVKRLSRPSPTPDNGLLADTPGVPCHVLRIHSSFVRPELLRKTAKFPQFAIVCDRFAAHHSFDCGDGRAARSSRFAD